MYTADKLSWLLAALAAGFAFIGLSYLIPEAYATLAVILFIVGALTVVIFATTIVIRAITTLILRQNR